MLDHSTLASLNNPARRSHRRTFAVASLLLAAGLATVFYLTLPAKAQIAVRNQGYVPYSDAPIHYRSLDLSDPVALLQKQLDNGQAKLTYEEDHGYLKSVLDLLKVPVDSQSLVFSKTSFQYSKISPDHPRALYYNDDVYVGSVHGGKAVEIVSFDPMQGAIFYLLDEHQADKPVFQRAELDCTQCHIAAGTRGIPGVLLRSVYPLKPGTLTPRAPSFITDQTSALKDRWGGWYVSGKLAKGTMANAVVVTPPPDTEDDVTPPLPRLEKLAQPFDAATYLNGGNSDAVVLLVLAHQTQMHNLITLTNYQTRLGLYALEQSGKRGHDDAAPVFEALPEATQQQIAKPAEQLLRYLLFVGETPLGGARETIGASVFATEFAKRGPRDSKGRSLRDFDLRDRIFQYPCSYLIYSSAFDALPEPAKGYVWRRLLEILSGEDKSAEFAGLSARDRQAILSILLETKPSLPSAWQDYAGAHHLKILAAPVITGSAG